MTLPRAAALGALLASAAAAEDEPDPTTVELAGRLGLEARAFPADAPFSDQRSLAAGFAFEPTLHLERPGTGSFTLTPFLRYDHSDPHRTHLDLRDAYFLWSGDAGDGGWEARLGASQVFWGVTESQHLVDIVNQVDFVEHPNGESRLGQPMAHLTWFGDWGTIEVIAMTFHRRRTFPGPQGRLRLPVVVAEDGVEYESSAGRWRPELAVRYGHTVDALDLGLTAFDGTSRAPYLRLRTGAGDEPDLSQFYETIRQFGLDAQWTLGAWLLKGEAVRRSGARDLAGRERTYFATVTGVEAAIYSVGGTNADLILFGEWSHDSRSRHATPDRSPNTLENDIFLGARVALNDVQSTEFTVSFLADVRRTTRTAAFELGRRLTDQWSLRTEAVALLGVDEADLHYEMRRDSFLDLSLTYGF